VVAETVYEREALFHSRDDLTGFHEPMDLKADARQQRISVESATSVELTAVSSAIRGAVYLHACLRYVNHEHTTNASVRKRFGIESQNIAAASRLIKEAVHAGRIVPYDPAAAPRLMRYVPAWAAPERGDFT
jgi:hypothetical protein